MEKHSVYTKIGSIPVPSYFESEPRSACLSRKEAAQLLKMTLAELDQTVADGKIQKHVIGFTTFFKRKEVVDYARVLAVESLYNELDEFDEIEDPNQLKLF